MDAVYSWAGCIVFSCAAVCIADMLLVKTPVQKTARFVFGVFLLGSIILPLSSVINETAVSISYDQPEFSQSEEMLLFQEEIAEEKLSELAENTLAAEGINDIVCKVDLICSEGEVTSVNCAVFLEGQDSEFKTKITEILRNKLGMSAEFVSESLL